MLLERAKSIKHGRPQRRVTSRRSFLFRNQYWGLPSCHHGTRYHIIRGFQVLLSQPERGDGCGRAERLGGRQGGPSKCTFQVVISLYTHCVQELFAREKASEIRELVLKQMSAEAEEPKEWWRVLVEVREAEKKRKMALQEDLVGAVERAEGDNKGKLEELAVVESTKKKKSRSKKKKSTAKATTNATTLLEEPEERDDNQAAESSKRVTPISDASPFAFEFQDESSSHSLVIAGTEVFENTAAASTVNVESDPQPGGKRHRKGSKSMTQLKVDELLIRDDSRDAAVERLKAEAPPISLEVAREKRTALRRERSGTIHFLRQRTLSRGSSVSASRPASPPHHDSAPDTDKPRLEEVTEVTRRLTSDSAIPKVNTTTHTSAHNETLPATAEHWQTATKQRRKKQQRDQVVVDSERSVQIQPSSREKQPNAVAKSLNQDHITPSGGPTTTLRITAQPQKVDQVVTSPELAEISTDPNVRPPDIAAVRKADENLSQQRLQKSEPTTNVVGSKEPKNETHVAVVLPVLKSHTSGQAKTNIAGERLSPQPLQRVEITITEDLEEPKDQGQVAAASPSNLEISHDATTDVTDEKHLPSYPQKLEITQTVKILRTSKDQRPVPAIPLRSNIKNPQHAKEYIADSNTLRQCPQGSKNTTTVDVSGGSKDQANVTTVSLKPDLEVSHHVIPDTVDEYSSPHPERKSQTTILEKSGASIDRAHDNGENSTATEPCHWLPDGDESFTDTEKLEKAIAAWQDQSDDEVESTANQHPSPRDPLFYSVNNEAYLFRDRPFVVPPQLENEENIKNGTCFPEIPPRLGNPYTGEISEQVPLTPPLICRCKRHGENQALIEYDPSIPRMIIHPSLHPLPDLRNNPYHPDWLPPFKLAEYQAYEQAGYPVYRFDRVTFECALSTCRKVLQDHVRSTILCNGCGPYTDVRYCSTEHLFGDCKTHWKICGLIPPRIVWNDWTMPSRYRRRYPAIRDVRGRSTPERHRQQAYSIHHRASDYVIFSDGENEPETAGHECRGTGTPAVFVNFHDGDPMKDTFNRLLNIAFFGKSLVTHTPYRPSALLPNPHPYAWSYTTPTNPIPHRPPPHPNPHPPLPPDPLPLPRPPPLDALPPQRPQRPTLPRILLRPAPPRLRARPLRRRLGRCCRRLVLAGLQARRRA